MTAPLPQQTIARPVRVAGFGLWSGLDVTVEFRPAPVDSGVVFVRQDLPKPVRIPAHVEYRIEIPRRTSLALSGATVEMVEHILAALAGLKITNCEVAVNAREMPGCDGSSQPFVDALLEAGIQQQAAPRMQLILKRTIRVGDDRQWVEASPVADGKLHVTYLLDYGRDNPIGKQRIDLEITETKFRRELAAARTFVMHEEAEWLRSCGLGQRVSLQDLLVFDRHGPIANSLRYADECVRHKALDVVGDLSLAGCDVVGHIAAFRSGHRLNAELVRALLAEGDILQPRRRSA